MTDTAECQVALSEAIHACFVQILKVAISLLLTHQGALNPLYYDADLRTHDALQTLHRHLNCSATSHLLPLLKEWADTADKPTQRLLRLLCR